MGQVTARPGESFESMWKRFKRLIEREGTLADLRKHEYFEKPSVKRKKKSIAARKRDAKNK
jgi:small subunit ribosomal protein S21